MKIFRIILLVLLVGIIVLLSLVQAGVFNQNAEAAEARIMAAPEPNYYTNTYAVTRYQSFNFFDGAYFFRFRANDPQGDISAVLNSNFNINKNNKLEFKLIPFAQDDFALQISLNGTINYLYRNERDTDYTIDVYQALNISTGNFFNVSLNNFKLIGREWEYIRQNLTNLYFSRVRVGYTDYDLDDSMSICMLIITLSPITNQNSLHETEIFLEYFITQSVEVNSRIWTAYGDQDLKYNFLISGAMFNQGYDSGYNAGTELGYDSGYNAGTELGYNKGYYDGDAAGYDRGYYAGFEAGQADGGPADFAANLFTSVFKILNIEIFPHFTLSTLLTLIVSFALLNTLIHLIRG